MKVIKITNSIISLENVRRVERRKTTSQHTKSGQKYSIDHYSVSVIYTDDKAEHIECGRDTDGQDRADRLMDEIFEILSKEA